MRKTCFLLTALLMCAAFVACNWLSDYKSDRKAVDGVKVHRYDRLLEEYIASNSFSSLQKLNSEYPQETRFLIEDVLSIGNVSDENIYQRLREYYADTLLRVISRDAEEKFRDMSGIEKDFSRAFRNLRRELPQLGIPRIYAMNSALNQSVVVGDSILGFSIDKYLGSDYHLYEHFYYDYQRRSMSPEYIVPECMRFYLLSEYPFPWEWHRTLLDHIIHQGKIHWVVSRLLETKTLEDEMGYTQAEGEWCRERRDSIWNYLSTSGQLHSTDPRLVRVYMHPSECCYPLGKDAPTEVGVWLGTHIVDDYMKKNKGTSIADLLRETDYRAILKNLQIDY